MEVGKFRNRLRDKMIKAERKLKLWDYIWRRIELNKEEVTLGDIKQLAKEYKNGKKRACRTKSNLSD